MKMILKTIAAGITGLMVIGASPAFANDKPNYCSIGHDHRSHTSNYYNYYDADRYSRAGAYRDSGVSFSIRFGNDRGYDRRNDRRYDRGHDRRHNRGYDQNRSYDNRAHHNRRNARGHARVVNHQTYQTRHRAWVVLTEKVVRGRRGHARLVCTVQARGPEADYVSERRINRIAYRDCSPRARIRILA